ncbi:M20/M25/M40 family metallo-hydrolase [Bacteroidales bacterium OttesenSCG-928-C19]|nr:M20/M25/M40 family metallo-hydrolase [Bacteroidales bacterium OttesenSCG-928-C19]
MKKYFFFVILYCFTVNCFAQTAEEKGVQSITVEAAKAHVNYLSNDALEGREAGTKGGEMASLYIVSRLEEIGIQPLLDTTYFQSFNIKGRKIVSIPKTDTLSEKEGAEITKLNNVLGAIQGESETEYVIIGAHYDHLGIDTLLVDDQIYNGADDNASGVSAVLQIAKACLAIGEKPKRTIVFAFWDGEEKGLLGSKYFTEHFAQIENVKAYLNFDMIGRNSDESKPMNVAYLYSEDYSNFKTWSEKDIVDYNLKITPSYHPSPYTMGGSDNASFTKNGIPIIWYHTGGHVDYHKPSDHADKINWEKLVDITKAAFLNIWKLANEEAYK